MTRIVSKRTIAMTGIALAAALVLLSGCFSGLGLGGGGQQPTPVLKTQASFSPDGMKLAFISTVSGEAQIYLANADGTNVKRLTTGSTNAQPTWSPDGSRILFSSNRQSKAGNEFELFIMNADGSDQKMIAIEIPAAK
jgi:dipeptidyl aminopeptidase/acylaminoacyl peptidase